MICKNCGFDNNDQSKFCVSCGTVLEQPVEPVVEQPTFEQPTYEQPQQPNYQYPNYQQPYNQQYNAYSPYPQQPHKQPGKGFAIAGMILGIISFLCTPIVTGVLGIIFGGVAKSKGYRGGMATAGIVCGILGIIGWILMIAFMGDITELYTELLEEMMYY